VRCLQGHSDLSLQPALYRRALGGMLGAWPRDDVTLSFVEESV
jgi:hypothetical protein